MTKITLKCEYCAIPFQKERGEHTRSKRLGRREYCSRTCSGAANCNHLRKYDNAGNISPGSSKDEFSPFRPFLKKCKQRKHECTVTLQDLKEQWEYQDGVCPITHTKMILVTSNYGYDKTNNPWKPSIDRVDSTRGYIPGNIRFVTHIANLCRSDWDDDTVREFARRVTS